MVATMARAATTRTPRFAPPRTARLGSATLTDECGRSAVAGRQPDVVGGRKPDFNREMDVVAALGQQRFEGPHGVRHHLHWDRPLIDVPAAGAGAAAAR